MKQLLLSLALLLALASATADAQARRLRVLFIGNSYTEYDNLPLLTQRVTASAGDTLTYAAAMIGGYKLSQHFTNAPTLALIRQGNWDRVVLQEQSQIPAFGIDQVEREFFKYGRKLDSMIHAHSPQARTYLYITWGRQNGDAGNCPILPWVCTYQGMDDMLRLRYEMLADELGAALAPVGPVRRRLRRTYPSLSLYIADGSHPTPVASYAAACTMYSALFAKPLTGVTYTAGHPRAVVDSIHKAVRIVATDSLAYWRVLGPTAAKPAHTQQALMAYPNPTRGLLYLNEPATATTATLGDATGRTLRTWIPANGPLNMADLPAGLYQLVIRSASGGVRMVRVVKE